jgi:hypothetical protein
VLSDGTYDRFQNDAFGQLPLSEHAMMNCDALKFAI